MFSYQKFLLLILLAALNRNLYAQAKESNNPYLADPTIFYEKGRYYLYGTVGGNNDSGFKVFVSSDQKSWSDKGFVLKKGESFGRKGFWAPQVFKYGQKYYMAYTADEHIAIAVADTPTGPFRQHIIRPLNKAVRMIDPFIFFDRSGKIYLYHVRLQEGNRIFIAEMKRDLSAIKEETVKECIHASDNWEDTKQASWKVTEGPTVFRHKGWYYMIYSANDFRNPDYAIGYAVARHPAGPWKKYVHNPILSKNNTGINGTGHGDLLTGNNGKLRYVFHVHNSSDKVAPRKTAIIDIQFKPEKNKPDKIIVNPPTFRLLHTAP
ncbi:MAG: glycoside hydrolase family 43 protein [Niabella sp.]